MKYKKAKVRYEVLIGENSINWYEYACRGFHKNMGDKYGIKFYRDLVIVRRKGWSGIYYYKATAHRDELVVTWDD